MLRLVGNNLAASSNPASEKNQANLLGLRPTTRIQATKTEGAKSPANADSAAYASP